MLFIIKKTRPLSHYLAVVCVLVTNNFIFLEYCNELKADLAETGIAAIADGLKNPIMRMPV
jgi:hypothetical protein